MIIYTFSLAPHNVVCNFRNVISISLDVSSVSRYFYWYWNKLVQKPKMKQYASNLELYSNGNCNGPQF